MSKPKSDILATPWYIRFSNSLTASFLFLATSIWIIYSNTLNVPFLFDDESSILKNTSLRHLSSLWNILHPKDTAGLGGRPLLNLSYAINYALGGTDVIGYHVFNIIIHILTAFLLLLILRISFKKILNNQSFIYYRNLLALIVVTLWAWHPLQTICVTYLSQRAESLMAFFYCLTFLLFIQGAYSTGRQIQYSYYFSSIITCCFGILTKEVMLTAPLAILLFDRTFITGSFYQSLKKRSFLYFGYALSLLPLISLTKGAHYRGVGFDQHIKPLSYALSESKVIINYIFLVLWPHPLIFDYGWYKPSSLYTLWPYIASLTIIILFTLYALIRWPKLSFSGLWFFILLCPTSSIIPIASQPMAENRLYLPVAAIYILLVILLFSYFGKRSLIFFSVVALTLGFCAFSRNTSYKSPLTLWSETVKENPLNARAHGNLGLALSKSLGHEKEAIEEYTKAVSLKPDSPEAHNDLGEALLHTQSTWQNGIHELQTAIEINPYFAEAHYNLGTAFLQNSDKISAAVNEFKTATDINPEFSEAYYNLGNALERLANYREAVDAYKKAISLNSNFAQAHANLGNVYYNAFSDSAQAINELSKAIEINPSFAEAHYNLGNILSKYGDQRPKAIMHFESALKYNPNFALAHNNLANLLIQIPGQENDAINHYRRAILLMPHLAVAHYNLGIALFKTAQNKIEARSEISLARELDPSLPPF